MKRLLTLKSLGIVLTADSKCDRKTYENRNSEDAKKITVVKDMNISGQSKKILPDSNIM